MGVVAVGAGRSAAERRAGQRGQAGLSAKRCPGRPGGGQAGPGRGPLGREPEVREAPVEDPRVLDGRNPAPATATARTDEHVNVEGASRRGNLAYASTKGGSRPRSARGGGARPRRPRMRVPLHRALADRRPRRVADGEDGGLPVLVAFTPGKRRTACSCGDPLLLQEPRRPEVPGRTQLLDRVDCQQRVVLPIARTVNPLQLR